MKKFRFIESGLAGDIYYPDPGSGKTLNSVGIFFYGFPSFVGPNEVTSALVSSGVLALQPHYYGSYDSNGVYSPASLIETGQVAQTLVDRGYVLKSQDQSRFNLPGKLEVCVGHSFGCIVALRSVRIFHSLRLLVLMAPAVHYSRSSPDFGLNEDGMEHLEYVRRSHPYTYRLAPPQEWQELLTGKDAIPTSTPHPTLERVVALLGEKDKYFDRTQLERNLPLIVKGYCGEHVKISFEIVPGVGHPVSEMLSTPDNFSLGSILREHNIGW